MDPSRGLNRKPYYEIEPSPHKHRPTPDHQPRRYHKTAKFQQSTRTETINHRQAIRPKHPNHGPNRRTSTENRSGPHRHRPTRRHQPATTPKPQNPNNPPAGPAPNSVHHPPRGPITRTESETILRNRNQSTRAPTDTRPPTTATPQNRQIPMNRAHYDNQLPPGHPHETPKPRTKPENGRIKPMQSTQAPTNTHPSPPATPQNRRTPTTCQQGQHRPPAHLPRNELSPQTKPEITWQHRNQFSLNRQASSRHHCCNSGIRRTIT